MILKAIALIIIAAITIAVVGYLVQRFSEDVEHLQKGIRPDTNKDQTKRLRGRRPFH